MDADLSWPVSLRAIAQHARFHFTKTEVVCNNTYKHTLLLPSLPPSPSPPPHILVPSNQVLQITLVEW